MHKANKAGKHADTNVKTPTLRRLRGYAFDPSLSIQLDTAVVNEVVLAVPWEQRLERGPVGEYVEVVDYDPASQCFYDPVDLNEPSLLAQDGLPPSEGNPQFHQQMVYAVAMMTIRNFERALGRTVLWAPHLNGKSATSNRQSSEYVQRLRIYPHALREDNAYYSPDKKAILFGYFPASPSGPGSILPGSTIFTCLSHDIVAHETTHALLDGMHRHFIEATHPDSLAFHEAFADIVALFQHFTFPEILRHQIAMTRGDLHNENLLGKLACEFGLAIGHYGALRDAIGHINPDTKKWEPLTPNPNEYQTTIEPHARGTILVAAVFDAFTSIYETRVADLIRIATNGTGVLPAGALHPDLVNRLAAEATKSARHVLNVCIRALDYCPSTEITFGDYLRAIVTSDADAVPDDEKGYRIAFVEAFRRRGIFPENVHTLSIESLVWPQPEEDLSPIFNDNASHEFRELIARPPSSNRQESYLLSRHRARAFHDLIDNLSADKLETFERATGLVLAQSQIRDALKLDSSRNGKYKFEVQSVRRARRISPENELLSQVIISLGQRRFPTDDRSLCFRGDCTLVFDQNSLELRYAIRKRIDDKERLTRQQDYVQSAIAGSLYATYFADASMRHHDEPLALLHRQMSQEAPNG